MTDTVSVPTEPTDAMLRPFMGCPDDELRLAWAAMLHIVKVAAPKPEYPQHCTTPEKCIAAGSCTRDPNCID